MRYIKTYELLSGGRITSALLKDLKADLNGWNELMYMITSKEFNSLSLFKKLLDSGKYNIEETDKDGNTALLLAAEYGKLIMMKKLIDAGANIYHKNKKGEDFYDVATNRYKFIDNIKDYIEKKYPEFVASKKYNL